jgi:hypothetical protein
MKKTETLLKEYVSKLSEDNLKFLAGRFTQRLPGDLAEAINFLSETNEMDRWLSSAKGSWDFYDMLDQVAKYVKREFDRRIGYKE